MVIGLERNQQDPEHKHVTTVRVLKNRFSGDTGVATNLAFNPVTGRMSEYTFEDFNG
jgi:twinkle protein